MSGCPLSDILVQQLDDTIVIRRETRDWHSATFSGKQIMLDLKSSAPRAEIDLFVRQLAEHAFSIPGLLVADIAATAQRALPDGQLLTVEALLLEDDI